MFIRLFHFHFEDPTSGIEFTSSIMQSISFQSSWIIKCKLYLFSTAFDTLQFLIPSGKRDSKSLIPNSHFKPFELEILTTLDHFPFLTYSQMLLLSVFPFSIIWSRLRNPEIVIPSFFLCLLTQFSIQKMLQVKNELKNMFSHYFTLASTSYSCLILILIFECKDGDFRHEKGEMSKEWK